MFYPFWRDIDGLCAMAHTHLWAHTALPHPFSAFSKLSLSFKAQLSLQTLSWLP